MPRYASTDLTIVVPTFDRPAKLTNLFESIVTQSAPVGRVIIVDGAENAEPVVAAFANRIPVEYHRCRPPGQIRQRNLGLAQLWERDRLVALLDDDIVLLSDAVAEMIELWNTVEPDTAGICFNIVNSKPEPYSLLGALLGLRARGPGRVLRSGMTTAISPAGRNERVQWLPGGATVWRREILAERQHREINARWAIAEDLVFSYPVGKRRPLYVCAKAHVRHEHVSDYRVERRDRYHGRIQTLWWYYFVSSNSDLSRVGFLWTLLLRIVGKLGRGAVHRDRASIEFAVGQSAAAAAIIAHELRGHPIVTLLEEPQRA